MTPPEEAQQLIEEHIATLDEHKASLERALSHLTGTAGENRQQRRGQQGGGRGGRGQARRGRRQGAGQVSKPERGGDARTQPQRGAGREKVIADLEANCGSKAAEIASRAGISATHANTILGNLVKQGRATKEGPRYTLA